MRLTRFLSLVGRERKREGGERSEDGGEGERKKVEREEKVARGTGEERGGD